MAFKVYTKTGDDGSTGLFGGTRLPKDHYRIEAYGTVDELNSVVGWLREMIEMENTEKLLIEVQHRLFDIGSSLATDPNKDLETPKLSEDDTAKLEDAIDSMEEKLPDLKNFILPGGNKAAAACHMCRSVTRRAERRIISLAREDVVDEDIVPYINRLSDYFFVLSRFIVHQAGDSEVIWKSRS